MRKQNISNIREHIWKIIDTDMSIRKDLSRGIINMRALAQYIITTYKLNLSLDSVISAIRRYNIEPEKKRDIGEVYSLLKKAKIKTLSKMASLSLKKNDDVTRKLGKLLPEVNYEEGETLRVLEGAKLFRIVVDQQSLPRTIALFKGHIMATDKKIGMLEMTYPDILMKTPGVFSVISSQLSENDISIIDALICGNEHILMVAESDLLKSFEILYTLCS
ncbi:hypothetical protein H6504_05220 [Candidatus Woesearchaeota archaeon]|nr:hypothetical protein [Candidatus Woesearchaeota archaeon]